MRTAKIFAIAILMYIVPDLFDPSIRGVFSFESDELFVDTVIQIRAPESLLRPVTAVAEGPIVTGLDSQSPPALARNCAPVTRSVPIYRRRTPERRSFRASPPASDDGLA